MKRKPLALVGILIFMNSNGMNLIETESMNDARVFFQQINSGIRNQRQEWQSGMAVTKLSRISLNRNGRECLINHVRNGNKDKKRYINLRVNIPNGSEFALCCIMNKTTGLHYSSVYMLSNTGQQWKPYLYNLEKRTSGILDDFIQGNPAHAPLYTNYINYFAINVLKLLKYSTEPVQTEPPNQRNRLANQYVKNCSYEIATLILTSERLRSEQSLLPSYIQLYKLKHCSGNRQKMLMQMFDRNNPTLRFPKTNGGSENIRSTPHEHIYQEFIGMFQCSSVYAVYNFIPFEIQPLIQNEFFKAKLDKLHWICGTITDKPLSFVQLLNDYYMLNCFDSATLTSQIDAYDKMYIEYYSDR